MRRNRMLTGQQIARLRKELELALSEHTKTRARTEELSEGLTLIEAKTYLDHDFVGKNAEARQAEAIVLLSTSEAVAAVRKWAREAQYDEAIAKARVEIATRDIQLWIAAAREMTGE